MRKSIFPLAAATMVACLILSGCGKSKNDGAGPIEEKQIDVLIDWQAEPTYLGIYYAVDKGYFSELGYDAQVTESWGANQAVAAIASGTHVIGTASGGATVLGTNNGADVVSLGVLYPRIPTVIYGLSDSAVKDPVDLIGKRIGIYPASITANEFDAFIAKNGIEKTDIEVVALSGADIPYLLSGQVDAVLHYTEMSPVLVETSDEFEGISGERTFELSLADYGVGGYGLNIIANKDAYQADPEELDGMKVAIVRGYIDGCANQTDAVNSFVKRFPEKSMQYVSESWSRVCNLIGTEPGQQSADGWFETIELYRDLGILTSDVSASDILGE